MKSTLVILFLLLAAAPLAAQQSRAKLPTPTVELFSAQTTWAAPCPPEPEPCPRGESRKGWYQALYGTVGAVAGAFVAAAVCPAEGAEEKRGCPKQRRYAMIAGAAVGAVVGVAAVQLGYSLIHEDVSTPAAPPSVDLVTFRIPVGLGRLAR